MVNVIMNEKIREAVKSDVPSTISSFLKSKGQTDVKKGVDLASIAHKLTERKFGKKK